MFGPWAALEGKASSQEQQAAITTLEGELGRHKEELSQAMAGAGEQGQLTKECERLKAEVAELQAAASEAHAGRQLLEGEMEGLRGTLAAREAELEAAGTKGKAGEDDLKAAQREASTLKLQVTQQCSTARFIWIHIQGQGRERTK